MKKSELQSLIREEVKKKLKEQSILQEFDPTSYMIGQTSQALSQSGPIILSATEKIIYIGLLLSGIGVAGWVALAKEINPIKAIKYWYDNYKRNKDLKPIIDRLKNDPEVMKYVNNKNLKGIQKVLASKLSDSEQKHIRSLTRDVLSTVKQES